MREKVTLQAPDNHRSLAVLRNNLLQKRQSGNNLEIPID